MQLRTEHYLIPLFLGLSLLSQFLSAQVVESVLQAKSERQGSYPIPSSFFLWKQEQEIRRFLAQHPEAFKSMALHKATAWPFDVNSTKSWYADDITSNPRLVILYHQHAERKDHTVIFSWKMRVGMQVA